MTMAQEVINILLVIAAITSVIAYYEYRRGQSAAALNENIDEKNALAKLEAQKKTDDGASERAQINKDTVQEKKGTNDEDDSDLANFFKNHDAE
jgi:hypothetical protein